MASFCIVSCSGLFSSLSEGAVSLTLPGASSSARSASDGTGISDSKEIAKFELSFTMGGSVKTLSALPGATITQDGLDPGTWTITGKAVSADNAVIGYGTSSAEVAAGRTTNAVLAMSFNSYENLASIAVTKNPAKTEYTLGDTVDYTGIEITASFKSGWKCVLDTSSLKDMLTYSPAEGSELTALCSKVTVTLKTDNNSVSADFPITVSVDAPVITAEPAGLTLKEGNPYSLSCTASCASGGKLSFAWYVASADKETGTLVTTGITTDESDTTSTLAVEKAVQGDYYYRCIVTNTRDGCTVPVTSSDAHVQVLESSYSFTSFTAVLKDSSSYSTAGTLPDFSMFTVTETWTNSAGKTETVDGKDADYTISFPSGTEDACGSIPVPIMHNESKQTVSVNVTFKYDITAPSIDALATATNEAQYTGTGAISATVTNAPHTYYDAATQKTTAFYDSVKYQWQKDGVAYGDSTTTGEAAPAAKCTPDVSTAGLYKYTLTASVTGNTSYKNWCTGTVPEAVTSGAWPVTVTAWTAKFNNESVENKSTLTVAMGTAPSLVISNENDTTSTLTVTSGDTGTATVSQNVTAGNAITITPVKAGSTTLTVKAGTSTLMTFSVTVTKALSSISAALKDNSSYVLVGNKPTAGIFTVTKVYDDSSTVTAATTEYTVEAANTSYVGDITVTVTLTADTSKTCTVTVPYKYTMTAPTLAFSDTAVSEAQYTGNTTLSVTISNAPHTYYDSDKKTTVVFYDSVTYQWLKDGTLIGSSAVLGGATVTNTYTPSSATAGTAAYAVTASTAANTTYSTYCTGSVEPVTSAGRSVTVTPWTATFDGTSVTSGSALTVAMGSAPSLVISNENDSTSSLTVTSSDTGIATVSQDSTYTAGKAIPITPVKAGSATLTVKAGTSTLMTLPVTVTKALSSITAGLTDSNSYILVGSKPTADMFTVTKVYDDSSTDTAKTGEYTVKADNTSYIGNATVTVTLTADTSRTCTVTVPYKYTMTAPEGVSVSFTDTDSTNDAKVAQYTGSTALTASCSSFTTYTPSTQDYSIQDTVTYQWYSAATSDGSGTPISGATNATYTPSAAASGTVWYYAVLTTKCSGDTTSCANSTDTLSTPTDRTAVIVTPWTLSLTDTTKGTTAVTIANGGTQALTAGDSYSMQFANADADATSAAIAGNGAYVSWASDNTATLAAPTGSAPWTFTAPSATSAEQTITLTATLKSNSGTATFGIVTFTVPAKVTDTIYTDYATLKNAVGAIASGSTATFYVSGDMTTTSTTITVKGDVTILADSACTITRLSTFTGDAIFTVNNGAKLTLGGSASKSLIIDGNSGNSVAATYPLINSAGSLEIAENCTLQNNNNTGSTKIGGAIYEYCTSGTVPTLTISGGTITGNTSAKNGGAINITGGSSMTINYVLSGGSITGNTSTGNGGGIYTKDATGTLSGTSITSNHATLSSAGTSAGGGGIYLATNSTLTMTGGSVSTNDTNSYGGGIFNAGVLTITGGTLSGNKATGNTASATIYGSYTLDGTDSTTTSSDITH